MMALHNRYTPPLSYPHAPGYQGTDTSLEAAEDMEPKAAGLRRRVLSVLSEWSMTADECAVTLGLDKLSIRPRCAELRELGAIEDSKVRRFNDSGKRAIVWQVRR